ncbi:cytochrome C oxidase subunit IV family protein [Crossiella equi]|nr:cytochrome C oxidase subunit IV family protein [Crossiella equi]
MVVWSALVVATLLSAVLSATSAVAVVVIAMAKVLLVGRYFMELRTAPGWLRTAFDAYCVVVCGGLVVLL